MYVVVALGKNQGRIVRYDTSILNKYTKKSGALRQAGIDYKYNKMSKNEKKIIKAVKVGPKINIGHGQAFSYNPQTKSLWIITSWNTKDTTKMEEISANSLNKTRKSFTFGMCTKYSNSTIYMTLKTLTFDKNGNFYGWLANGKAGSGSHQTALARIFKGHLAYGKSKAHIQKMF